MNRRLASLLLLAVVVAPGCSSAASSSKASDEQAVRAAMSGFMDALNALDAERMSHYFAEDITAFVPVAQADRAQGREAVTRIFQTFVNRTRPTTPRLNLTPEDLELVVSGDLGVVSFNIREPAIHMTRRRTFVFARTNGVWLIRHFHASDFTLPK